MEFGKLADISNVHWDLPHDDPKNSSRIKPENKFTLYFGSPAWGEKTWIGKLYPEKTPPEEFLHHYSRNFNCVELNTTHYRIPDLQTTKGWRSQVPEHFLFCPKLHKDISHGRMGLVDKTLLQHWLLFLNDMGKNLGPCFIQFHEMFSYQDKHLLFKFLENWPAEYKLTLELRHPSWFQNGIILPALTDYLHRKQIGLVITDVAGRRDVLHSSLSMPWTMIRLIGNNLDASDEKRLQAWAGRLLQWKEMGLQDPFVFLHQPDDIHTIEFSQMAEKIFKNYFSEVPHFALESKQESLF